MKGILKKLKRIMKEGEATDVVGSSSFSIFTIRVLLIRTLIADWKLIDINKINMIKL